MCLLLINQNNIHTVAWSYVYALDSIDPRDIYKYRMKQQTAEYINIISRIIRPTIYFFVIVIPVYFLCNLHVQKLYTLTRLLVVVNLLDYYYINIGTYYQFSFMVFDTIYNFSRLIKVYTYIADNCLDSDETFYTKRYLRRF